MRRMQGFLNRLYRHTDRKMGWMERYGWTARKTLLQKYEDASK